MDRRLDGRMDGWTYRQVIHPDRHTQSGSEMERQTETGSYRKKEGKGGQQSPSWKSGKQNTENRQEQGGRSTRAKPGLCVPGRSNHPLAGPTGQLLVARPPPLTPLQGSCLTPKASRVVHFCSPWPGLGG